MKKRISYYVAALIGIPGMSPGLKANKTGPVANKRYLRHALADGLDLDLGVRLTMSLLFAYVLLGLIVEYYDLFALDLIDNGCLGGNALYYGLADYDFVATKHQYFKCDLSAYFGVQLFDEDLVASFYLVLLAAGTDDSVHVLYLLL